ncbi:MAG: DUF364 domain-containing protein [Anaerolineae bacterium]|nr:DUF364 domain-containing protein [Anaerolineae bacterium]
MTVIDDLLLTIPPDRPVTMTRDVLIGLYWTAVHGEQVGIAATPMDTACCYARDVVNTGHLHEGTVNDLVKLVRSPHPLDVALGMAAFNALNKVDPSDGVELNARDVILERGRGKTVVTVGHFPFTDAIRQAAARTWVLELLPTGDDQTAEAAPDLIPQADVIGLTATTLLNGTFDGLAKLFPPHALVVMLGPSTPLNKVLFEYGVDILGGAVVTDPTSVLRYIEQGSALHRVPGLQRFTMTKQ